jgi:leucyl-tRNA synthetase
MSLVNDFYDAPVSRGDIKALLNLLSPFAPHVAEELWELQGFKGTAATAAWPEYDEAKTLDEEREIAVQVGGKLKGTIKIAADADDGTVVAAALADERIAKLVDGKEIARTIVVKNKLINLIV